MISSAVLSLRNLLIIIINLINQFCQEEQHNKGGAIVLKIIEASPGRITQWIKLFSAARGDF
jgi:hypothetical protein